MDLRRAPVLLALIFPAAAHACTVCDSTGGRALRQGVFNLHFGPTLAAVLSPFPVLAALLVLANRWLAYADDGSELHS